ncbi:MAG: hypothetical protein QXG39_04325 [Candidatus Aenigmatarchaeota archaeon]
MDGKKIDRLKRFIDLYIPIEACNLRCSYCYVTLRRKEKIIEKLLKISLPIKY